MLSQRQARLRRNIWSNLQAILDWAFVLHPSPILPPLRSFANVRSSPPLQCSACQLKLRAAACLSRGPPDQAGTPQSGVAARGSYLDSVSVRRHAKAAPRQGLMLHRLAPMFSVLCGFARSQRTSWTCWMRWRTVQPIPVNYEIGRFLNPRSVSGTWRQLLRRHSPPFEEREQDEMAALASQVDSRGFESFESCATGRRSKQS